jgi:cytochrome c551/c552
VPSRNKLGAAVVGDGLVFSALTIAQAPDLDAQVPAVAWLMAEMRSGNAGVWRAIGMPPPALVGEADARSITKSLAADVQTGCGRMIRRE